MKFSNIKKRVKKRMRHVSDTYVPAIRTKMLVWKIVRQLHRVSTLEPLYVSDGDRVLLPMDVDAVTNAEQAARMREALKKYFPEVEIIVVAGARQALIKRAPIYREALKEKK